MQKTSLLGLLLAPSLLALLAACGSSVTTGTGGQTSTSSSSSSSGSTSSSSSSSGSSIGPVGKVDLLLDVDNSRAMADKQLLLAEALPDLIAGLVNPKCVDPANPGDASKWVTPASPLDACPAGLAREFSPVTDMHVGVITSSIGGHGADACPDTESYSCPGGAPNATNNDKGHLVSRLGPCAGGTVQTYQGKGFLAWDPAQKLSPPGEMNVGALQWDATSTTVGTVYPGLVSSLKDMVLGAGQLGCGYEAPLESWYRFLVDPNPYESITIDASSKANPQGTDAVLLQQRKDFLRPDSLLAILMLTDENDCSTKEYGQFYFSAQQRDPANPNKNFYLPKPRHECATNPSDPCCRSCGQDQSGCPADPNCTGSLDSQTDDVNLRCWDQKRRFGIDFLYPVDRYITGLTAALVPDRNGEMVANPIFSNLDPSSGITAVRDPGLVVLAGVVGVPWQDVARDPHDIKKGFKTSAELAAKDAQGHSTWDYIIGDPASYTPPLDPHMIESASPRQGKNPITGDTLAAPSKAPGPGPDAISGHEYTTGTQNGVQVVPDELEYACIFPLAQPRDCTDFSIVACNCNDPQNDNPLCEAGNNGRTLQVRAKAHPGTRPLSVLRGLGTQGVVGSVCPAQVADPSGADYGYRQAMSGLLDAVKGRLAK